MTVILDLDYTLLDTGRFKEALASVFADCGISRKRFLETYRQIVERDQPAYDYDPACHAALLAAEISCRPEDLLRAVQKVMSGIDAYFYSGAEDFVAELRRLGGRIVLLSLGNAGWQEEKIKNSRFAQLFDEIILVRSGKEDVLHRFVGNDEPVIVINDNCAEVALMHKAEPSVLFIVKRGPKEVPDGFSQPVCSTFQEILEQVRKFFQ